MPTSCNNFFILATTKTILMGSDIHENTSENFKVGNNFTISVTTNSKEQADAYFASLSKNGTVLQAMELMFWGDYFGMCTDAIVTGKQIGRAHV